MVKFTPALTLVVCLASLSACRAQGMAKPLGKWERKLGKSHVTLIIEENRLHAMFFGDNPCILHADYSMTKDGVIYGVVTSIECDDDEDAVKTMCDAPFSCRYRIDEGALIIRDLKCHEVDSKDNVWNGRFKAVVPSTAQTVSDSPPPATVGRLVPCPSSSTSSGMFSSSTASNQQLFNFYTGISR